MANKVQTFFKKNLGEVRVVMKRGNPWFVAADLMKVLGYSDVSSKTTILNRLDPAEKGSNIIATPGGNQRVVVVNESGLYYLICTSSKPNAKAFRMWVTNTVLPSIRKTGGYISGQESLSKSEKSALEDIISKLSKELDTAIKERDSAKEEAKILREEIEEINNELEAVRIAADKEDINEYLSDREYWDD